MTKEEGLIKVIEKLLREKRITEEQAIILLRINTSNGEELTNEEKIPSIYEPIPNTYESKEFNVYEGCGACSPKYGAA